MWLPKFLRPHAWLCGDGKCKKFEITPTGRKPSWVRNDYSGYAHWVWKERIVNKQDFGTWVVCCDVSRVLAREGYPNLQPVKIVFYL